LIIFNFFTFENIEIIAKIIAIIKINFLHLFKDILVQILKPFPNPNKTQCDSLFQGEINKKINLKVK
jgi:hypothetical protein